MHENASKFLLEFWELLSSYEIKSSLITVENSRPNIIEQMHYSLEDMIRTKCFESILNPMREVDILLSSFAWVLQATVSSFATQSLTLL